MSSALTGIHRNIESSMLFKQLCLWYSNLFVSTWW